MPCGAVFNPELGVRADQGSVEDVEKRESAWRAVLHRLKIPTERGLKTATMNDLPPGAQTR